EDQAGPEKSHDPLDPVLARPCSFDVIRNAGATRRTPAARLADEPRAAPRTVDSQAERHGPLSTAFRGDGKKKGRRASLPVAPTSRRHGDNRLVAARFPELVVLGAQRHDVVAAALDLVLPGPEPAPQVVGADVEHVADVLKREQPGAI